MLRCLFAILCCLLSLSPAVGDDAPKSIGPAEAAKKVNQEVTLLMEINSSSLSGNTCFLNSETDFKDAKNFTLFIDKDVLAKFKTAKIEDPAAHFNGKTVQVTGKVILYRNHPEIKVAGPDAIKIVEKK